MNTVPTTLPLAALVLFLAGCGGINGKKPFPQGEKSAGKGMLLSDRALRARATTFSQMRAQNCAESDLTLFGLVKLINKSLATAGCKEEMIIGDYPDVSVEYAVVRNIFSVYFDTKKKLDKASLAAEISRGSVFDLIYNLRDLCAVTVGWFENGLYINEGDNPLDLGLGHEYKLRFE
jgi:hypothetical protein